MRTLLGFVAMIVLKIIMLPTLSYAQLSTTPNATQLIIDARVALNQIHQLQSMHHAEWEKYQSQTDLNLNYKLPTYLSPYYSLEVTLQPGAYTAKLTGIAAPVLGRTHSINQTGKLVGLTQYSSASELIKEINQLIITVHLAQKAYYAEWGKYNASPLELGVVVPTYLNTFGTLVITVTTSSYQVEFKGKAYPITGQIIK